MKIKHYLLFLLCAATAPVLLSSCSETDDTENDFADWQNRNNEYFSAIYETAKADVSGKWLVLKNYSLNDNVAGDATNSIVVEKIVNGTGSGCPMYSDSVLINYRGRLMPSDAYPDGYVFDESYNGDNDTTTAKPSQMYVGGLVDGMTTALQHMHIGDKWRIYIPYRLGYGTAAQSSIPAYSTLVFDVRLVAYYRAGTKPGVYYAKRGTWIKE